MQISLFKSYQLNLLHNMQIFLLLLLYALLYGTRLVLITVNCFLTFNIFVSQLFEALLLTKKERENYIQAYCPLMLINCVKTAPNRKRNKVKLQLQICQYGLVGNRMTNQKV